MAKPTSLKSVLPKDHLAAIGAIAVVWTGIESSMELTILGLYEIDMGRGLVLTSNLSFHARLSLLRILAGESVHMTAEQASHMNNVLNRIDSAYGERNAIVHGLWGPTKKLGIINRISVRARGKKLNLQRQDYSAADLWAIEERLFALGREFKELGEALGIEERLEAAPRHSREPNILKTART